MADDLIAKLSVMVFMDPLASSIRDTAIASIRDIYSVMCLDCRGFGHPKGDCKNRDRIMKKVGNSMTAKSVVN